MGPRGEFSFGNMKSHRGSSKAETQREMMMLKTHVSIFAMKSNPISQNEEEDDLLWIVLLLPSALDTLGGWDEI